MKKITYTNRWLNEYMKRFNQLYLLICLALCLLGCQSYEAKREIKNYKDFEVLVKFVKNSGYEVYDSFEGLPSEVKYVLKEEHPNFAWIADRGEPFNETDVVRPNFPMSQFVAAYVKGDSFYVVYRTGGFVAFQSMTCFSKTGNQFVRDLDISMTWDRLNEIEMKEWVISGDFMVFYDRKSHQGAVVNSANAP